MNTELLIPTRYRRGQQLQIGKKTVTFLKYGKSRKTIKAAYGETIVTGHKSLFRPLETHPTDILNADWITETERQKEFNRRMQTA